MIIFQKQGAAAAWMRLCPFLSAFQASEQRQKACRWLQSVRRSVTLAEREQRKPSQSRADSSGNSVPNQSSGGGSGRQGYIHMLMNSCEQQYREASRGQVEFVAGLPTFYQFLGRHICNESAFCRRVRPVLC